KARFRSFRGGLLPRPSVSPLRSSGTRHLSEGARGEPREPSNQRPLLGASPAAPRFSARRRAACPPRPGASEAPGHAASAEGRGAPRRGSALKNAMQRREASTATALPRGEEPETVRWHPAKSVEPRRPQGPDAGLDFRGERQVTSARPESAANREE